MYHKSGDIYDGNWVEGQKEGQAKINYISGAMYEGFVSKGIYNGFGRLESFNRDIYEGQWFNGTKSGEGKLRYSNGDMFDGSFQDDKIWS